MIHAIPSPNPTIVLRLQFPPDIQARLQAAYPEARFVTCQGDAGLDENLEHVEALVGGLQLAPELAARMPRLRWVQALGVGVEGFLASGLRERGVQVANGRGVNVEQLAEHAIMLILCLARGMPAHMRRQVARQWMPSSSPEQPRMFELSGTRLGLIGYGEIGRAIARLARAFGMQVWATRRFPTADRDDMADCILAPDRLGEVLESSDHVVVVAPLTSATRGLMNADAFARMKPTACFYNLARGALMDQQALIDALLEKRIFGAGLDVTDPEPLPSDSRLWSLENVIITPHTGGNTPRFMLRMADFLVDQLGRFRRGESVRNLINYDGGY
jgi:phosphoglycerate dehydrogenase-like enzyme